LQNISLIFKPKEMKNKSLSFKNILLESLFLSLIAFWIYGLNTDSIIKYLIFVLVGIPVLFAINWLLIQAIRRFTNWKEVNQ